MCSYFCNTVYIFKSFNSLFMDRKIVHGTPGLVVKKTLPPVDPTASTVNQRKTNVKKLLVFERDADTISCWGRVLLSLVRGLGSGAFKASGLVGAIAVDALD